MAVRPPTTFCSIATTDATTIMIATSGPPRFSTRTLAPNPIEAKNVFWSGVCSAVSNVGPGHSIEWSSAKSAATGRPPTTGAGML